MTKEDKINLLDRILWADSFSNTLKKYSVRISKKIGIQIQVM